MDESTWTDYYGGGFGRLNENGGKIIHELLV